MWSAFIRYKLDRYEANRIEPSKASAWLQRCRNRSDMAMIIYFLPLLFLFGCSKEQELSVYAKDRIERKERQERFMVRVSCKQVIIYQR